MFALCITRYVGARCGATELMTDADADARKLDLDNLDCNFQLSFKLL